MLGPPAFVNSEFRAIAFSQRCSSLTFCLGSTSTRSVRRTVLSSPLRSTDSVAPISSRSFALEAFSSAKARSMREVQPSVSIQSENLTIGRKLRTGTLSLARSHRAVTTTPQPGQPSYAATKQAENTVPCCNRPRKGHSIFKAHPPLFSEHCGRTEAYATRDLTIAGLEPREPSHLQTKWMHARSKRQKFGEVISSPKKSGDSSVIRAF